MTETTAPTTTRADDSGLQRLLTGRTSIDFVGRSGLWLKIVVASLLLCAIGGAVRGLNFGIDFVGGTSFTVSDATRDFTADELRAALTEAGAGETTVQLVEGGEGAIVSTAALEEPGAEAAVLDAIVEVTGADRTAVDVNVVGPRWGAQITRQALEGLLVFLVLIMIYIAVRFEWRMAVAAVLTLLHDVALTIGIYALVGFEVTPASVIAFLTILGYSLYDTVVVFDRVKEDTAGIGSTSTTTYGEAANRALNEVLVRSISTSLTSLLPVGSLLFIGATILGADTLQDLALALFIGMAVGTYSSVIVATPLLVWLKEKEPRYAELKHRVAARRRAADAPAAAGGAQAPAEPAEGADAGSSTGPGSGSADGAAGSRPTAGRKGGTRKGRR